MIGFGEGLVGLGYILGVVLYCLLCLVCVDDVGMELFDFVMIVLEVIYGLF